MTGMTSIVNPSPQLTEVIDCPDLDDSELDALRDHIYSCIRTIRDPEHSYSLEQLGVVSKQTITFPSYAVFQSNNQSTDKSMTLSSDQSVSLPTNQALDDCELTIEIRPTVPHCSLATLIGLCIRTRVKRDWPNLKLSLNIQPIHHLQASEISKQLNDKERCLAALENPALAETVEALIKHQEGMYD